MKIILVSKCSLDIQQHVEFKMSVLISPSKSLISSRWVTFTTQKLRLNLKIHPTKISKVGTFSLKQVLSSMHTFISWYLVAFELLMSQEWHSAYFCTGSWKFILSATCCIAQHRLKTRQIYRWIFAHNFTYTQARIQGGCFGGYSTPGYESQKKKKKRKEKKEKEKEKERKTYCNHVMRLQQSISFWPPSDTGTERGWGSITWSV